MNTDEPRYSLNFMEKLLDGVTVELKPLQKVGKIIRGSAITEKETKPGKYPVVGNGPSHNYFHNQSNRNGETIVIARSGAYAGLVSYWDVPIFLTDAFSIHPDLDILKTKFLFYLLKNDQTMIHNMTKGAGVPHVRATDFESYQIPIPCPDNPQKSLQIQAEIVRILDTFTELAAELTAELTARKKQYGYYRDKLLTFESADYADSRRLGKGGEVCLSDRQVEWRTLGEVYKFQYGKGNTIPTSGGKYPVYGSNGIVGSHSEYNSEDSPVIGHIGAYAGIVNWGTGKHFVTYNGVICKLINKNVHSRYAYYQLLKQDFNSMAKNSSQPFVSYKELNEVIIPIPPLAEQARIVDILDKFDALTSSITEGLPREIELRKKQYEYYRNLLLTFPKKN